MRRFADDLSLWDHFAAPLTLAISWSAHFRLRLELAIRANHLIRYLVPCRPRCSSAQLSSQRTEMIPFSFMLERLVARICRSGPFCLGLPVPATFSLPLS